MFAASFLFSVTNICTYFSSSYVRNFSFLHDCIFCIYSHMRKPPWWWSFWFSARLRVRAFFHFHTQSCDELQPLTFHGPLHTASLICPSVMREANNPCQRRISFRPSWHQAISTSQQCMLEFIIIHYRNAAIFFCFCFIVALRHSGWYSSHMKEVWHTAWHPIHGQIGFLYKTGQAQTRDHPFTVLPRDRVVMSRCRVRTCDHRMGPYALYHQEQLSLPNTYDFFQGNWIIFLYL